MRREQLVSIIVDAASLLQWWAKCPPSTLIPIDMSCNGILTCYGTHIMATNIKRCLALVFLMGVCGCANEKKQSNDAQMAMEQAVNAARGDGQHCEKSRYMAQEKELLDALGNKKFVIIEHQKSNEKEIVLYHYIIKLEMEDQYANVNIYMKEGVCVEYSVGRVVN